MSEMIERVANALMKVDADEKISGYRKWAEAAIEAMREPTDAMCEAMLTRVEEAQAGEGAPFKWPDVEHMFDVHAASIDEALK